MAKQMRADLMLAFVALCWGFSYYMVDLSLTELGPFTLNAMRFLLAFAAAMAAAFQNLKKVGKKTMLYSAGIGAVVTVVYINANYGVMYTSLSNAGFLCALAVVFTPALDFAIRKNKPGKKLAAVVVMSCVSIALLTLNEELKPALGDLFCILCAFASSFHLLITESAVRKEGVNAFHLGVYQLAFVGLFNSIVAVAVEKPQLPSSLAVWGAVLFLAVFCTGLAFIALTVAQQYTTATHTGVIFTLEPVFAGFVAFFLAGEILLPRAYFGAALLIAGILIMEVDTKRLFS
ncbi:MAG: DMT family transporter [Clostridiales bacterium]|nr:DMT family transporter [Clostridiales bacterium]